MRIQWEKREANGNGRTGCRWVVSLLPTGAACPAADPTPPVELGSIEDRYLTVNIPATRAFHQGLFWERVRKRLADIPIDSAEKARLESAIAEIVPLPCSDWALWGVSCIPRYDGQKRPT